MWVPFFFSQWKKRCLFGWVGFMLRKEGSTCNQFYCTSKRAERHSTICQVLTTHTFCDHNKVMNGIGPNNFLAKSGLPIMGNLHFREATHTSCWYIRRKVGLPAFYYNCIFRFSVHSRWVLSLSLSFIHKKFMIFNCWASFHAHNNTCKNQFYSILFYSSARNTKIPRLRRWST